MNESWKDMGQELKILFTEGLEEAKFEAEKIKWVSQFTREEFEQLVEMVDDGFIH